MAVTAARATEDQFGREDTCESTLDPVEAAELAGLRYVTDGLPGITRKRAGKHFSYIGVDGKPIHDSDTLARIKSLAIPPAWANVWISPIANGHLQATGRDAKGRKQYRYHPRWREVRDETKYDHLLDFGQALPGIRARVEHDLSLHGLPRDKVLATVVRLLETTLIRVGNEEYVRENHHYGLTTLEEEHVDVDGSKIEFHFTGKSGIQHVIDVKDKHLARIVKRLRELPGHHLFQYVDEHGRTLDMHSDDVNRYLREITEHDFTAKDFRTWAGTLLVAVALEELEPFDSVTEARKNVVQAIEQVARRLGNTPAVCRKCYVHPEIIAAYMEGITIRTVRERAEQEMAQGPHELSPDEAAVMALLQQRLKRDEEQGSA
ncbi:MAG TPA: DNA topoisomerase IB [Chloroflexota bacterium]